LEKDGDKACGNVSRIRFGSNFVCKEKTKEGGGKNCTGEKIRGEKNKRKKIKKYKKKKKKQKNMKKKFKKNGKRQHQRRVSIVRHAKQ
jgi:hypothetical protein